MAKKTRQLTRGRVRIHQAQARHPLDMSNNVVLLESLLRALERQFAAQGEGLDRPVPTPIIVHAK